MFLDDHLAGITADASLNYQFTHRETALPDIQDTVTVSVRADPARGRIVNAEFLHEERKLSLPEVDHAEANPVVLYFLEHDVRAMRKRLGGMENYFRKRIRLALANDARIEPVSFEYGGVARKGSRVEVTPYLGDPNTDRFKGMDGKRYQFTLSTEVPGGVYEIRTSVQGDAARQIPQVEEILRLAPQGG